MELEQILEEKNMMDRIYTQYLINQYEKLYYKKIQENYNNSESMKDILILQKQLNVRLLELEPLTKRKCDEIKRIGEFQNGFYDENEYVERLKTLDQLYFYNFKFVIGINDFKIRIEMSAIINPEDTFKLIGKDGFNDNIMIYFNDQKIDSRELQGNDGPSVDLIYEHFTQVTNDRDAFYIVYDSIIKGYMHVILLS